MKGSRSTDLCKESQSKENLSLCSKQQEKPTERIWEMKEDRNLPKDVQIAHCCVHVNYINVTFT